MYAKFYSITELNGIYRKFRQLLKVFRYVALRLHRLLRN
jgi:hypothetical protein